MSGHLAFVTGAYAVSAIVLALLVAAILADHRARRRELAELEAAGIRRRSARNQKAAT